MATTTRTRQPGPPRRRVETEITIVEEPFKRSAESIGDALAMASYRGHNAAAEGWALTCKRCKLAGTISKTAYEGELFEKGCGS